MEIIFYRDQNVAGGFEAALRSSFPQIMAYTSITSLCTRLSHTPAQGVVIVLAAANDEELSRLVSIRHLFEDALAIFILPVKDGALLGKAHKLHPRFIGDLESGPDEVIAVIGKMLTREKPTLETIPSGP